MENKTIRKIFLDELPRREGMGALKGQQVIDWKNSINKKVKFIYDDIKGEIEIIDYLPKNQSLIIKYNNDSFEIQSGNFQRCQLGKLLGKITSEFKIEIGQVFKDDKRDITIIDRKYIKNKNERYYKYYKYRCNKCGFDCGNHYKNGKFKEEHWVQEISILKGFNCGCCSNSSKIVVPHINSIVSNPETHWMIKYFQGGYDEAKLYTKLSDTNLNPICPDCGKVKDRTMKIGDIYKNKSIGCSCGDGCSYPHKFMFNMLKQLKIEFTDEYSPIWIGRKRYDFYFKIRNNKYIIETDGKLGHGKSVHSKSNKTIEETKADDDYKDMMAKEHGLDVIRINCDKSELEYIRDNILKSKLNNLFNLNNIDWNKCEEFALSNRAKEACEYKKNNPEMTTVDIGEIMNMSISTINKYLRRGNELGWCDYDPKEENRIGLIKARETNKRVLSKQVEVFKDGISLGMFASCSELERQSDKLFGVKLLQCQISKVCNNKRNHHKGFTFKYV